MEIYVIKASGAENISDELLKRFQHKKTKSNNRFKTHCYTYLMLDRILDEVYNIENREIVFDNNKPIMSNMKKHFSISHSRDYIALAFSDSNCGVDIENNRPRNYEMIAKRMNFQLGTQRDFYVDWTIYEAVYKLATKPQSTQTYEVCDYIITAVSENPNEKFELYFETKKEA